MNPEYTRQEPENTTTSLGAFALQYAQNGWPIFPLHGKIPYKDFHWRDEATTDLEQITTWWNAHPGANIGLVTGEQSGVLVLDIDPRHGGYYSMKELQSLYEPLPPTLTTKTAHGGLHRYFQHPQDGNRYPNTVKLAGYEGLDFRGDGGYVVLPPSTLYGRLSYRWADPETPIAPLPAWLHTLVPIERASDPQAVRFARSPDEYWLSQALQQATEGNRNDTGFWLACQLRDARIPQAQARQIMLTYANRAAEGKERYTAKEALASLTQAYKRPPRAPARRR